MEGNEGCSVKVSRFVFTAKDCVVFDHRKQHSHGGHSSSSCACEESEKEEEHKANKRC